MRYTSVVAVLAILCAAKPAQAYIDPGTGSFLVQGIIAAILWRRVKAFFTRGAPADERKDG